MKVYYNLDLENFQAWSGGKITLNRVIEEGKINDLEYMVNDLFGDEIGETQLNDFLWFDSEYIYESLGIEE